MHSPKRSMTYLEKKHAHVQDKDIFFYSANHEYRVNDQRGFVSVTQLVKTHFPRFVADDVIKKMMASPRWKESAYFGLSVDTIKKKWAQEGRQAAEAGTRLHAQIEHFYNQGDIVVEENDVALEYFLEFDAQLGTHLYPYRTEWKVYDASLYVAGTIDMVFRKEDRAGSPLVLYDWKRSKKITRDNRWQSALPEGLRHLPDSNFWRYALQMNLYRYIIEKNYDHTVEGMFLVAFHPNNPNGSFLPYEVPKLTNEVDVLVSLRKQQLSDLFEN